MVVGSTVTVFGKHLCKVLKITGNGKRILVHGKNYSGWTKLSNVKVVTDFGLKTW